MYREELRKKGALRRLHVSGADKIWLCLKETSYEV